MALSYRSLFANLTLAFALIAPTFAHSEENSPESMTQNLPLVELQTTQGTITLQLFPYAAPKACENFLTHVQQGYYDGLLWHRVIAGFMIQGGDPTGTGSGGASIWGRTFDDEFYKGLNFDRPGLLAMANAGPRTNGSQFFITVAATPWLNKRHTIFGEVIKGYETVLALSQQKTGPGDRPLAPQRILKASVIQP